MCRRVQCSSCGKPTFAGCGMHVEQVLGDVPKPDRCDCRSSKSSKSGGAGTRASGEPPAWLKSFFGKL